MMITQHSYIVGTRTQFHPPFAGIITTIIGLVLFTLEHKVPKKLAEFFLLESLQQDEEYRQLHSNVHGCSTPDVSFKSVSNLQTWIHFDHAFWIDFMCLINCEIYVQMKGTPIVNLQLSQAGP